MDTAKRKEINTKREKCNKKNQKLRNQIWQKNVEGTDSEEELVVEKLII